MWRRCVLLLVLAIGAQGAAAETVLRDGDALLLRHALAPGGGDPPGFRLGDCSTQRTLSDEGRAQARALGARLRSAAVPITAVWASPWCRTHETARLAMPDLPVQVQPAFASFFQTPGAEDEQTRQARALLAGWRGPGVLLVVTHQVNITALTGQWPRSGEGMVWRAGAFVGPW